ncbi:MAG: phosphoenolpyruvate synthase [Clostridia bacterium]|nr:phosphoenolpyruvate synthase [Clostridia bacterium]
MAAFDKVKSGFPQMDDILDYIRMGDNVVWQVSDIDEFRFFAVPFVEQAKKDGRDILYIRFAQHPPILDDLTGVKMVEFDPDAGFEAFTVAIHDEITRAGWDAFYVFDCLSELQSVWYTDLMMGNFFRVTCPYLFELDTVAYFPVLRGRHSFDAIARIRETTQLLLDVCSNGKWVYLHPLKVWRRNSDTMFMPHGYRRSTGEFQLIDNGVSISRYYQTIQEIREKHQDQNIDSHDRFFNMARSAYAAGQFTPEMEEQIIDSTMTKDKHLKGLVKAYFAPSDYFLLRDRMIGSGAIGGKACGMLLARKIAETEIDEYRTYSEPHDSFYIGSDVFYTYIVANGSWRLRIRQRTPDGYFAAADELKARLLSGQFPDKIREQFRKVLEYFGQNPFIVRSSSFLEDGFGNAFAGKYESVFCVNRGTEEERLEAFENAVRTVYASTMDASALEYRLRRGLDRRDEQMAILVQRVSGSYWGRYFMPCAAGVGYSHSAYQWYPNMDPKAGMLRLVMGLGTKAVDRTTSDYPRLANLDRPTVTVYTTVAQKHRFSQRFIDALDCKENRYCEVVLERLLPDLPLWYRRAVMEHDYEAENMLREMGQRQEIWFASCQGLLENAAFTGLMQRILKTLERVYGTPVDIEYAINLDREGDFVVNLLQCRPLYIGGESEKVSTEDLSLEKVLFEVRDASMGTSKKKQVDVVVRVDPAMYDALPYARKPEVATAIGKINRFYADSGRNLLLLAPGRVGTSSPELGIPTRFSDISCFSVICEVSDKNAGFMPELSYGSHMFQDMVEAEMSYSAIWDDPKTIIYDPALLGALPNRFAEICPDQRDFHEMITVTEPSGLCYWLDSVRNRAVCGFER